MRITESGFIVSHCTVVFFFWRSVTDIDFDLGIS